MSKPCVIDGCGRPLIANGLCSVHYARKARTGVAGPPHLLYRRFGAPGDGPKWLAEHVRHEGKDCLVWPFARSKKDGRGYVHFRGRAFQVSRAMCILAHGDPPTPEHFAVHNCGNGHLGCVNPTHLRWATQRENLADMIVHGTIMRGTKNPAHKLTAEEVRAIRKHLREGRGRLEIAERYGVHRTCVAKIERGESWGWLE